MYIKRYKISRFWSCYFIIRLFYFLFTILVYTKLTTLGDTEGYLNANVNISMRIFYLSTYFMEFFGGYLGKIFKHNMLLSNILPMLISYFTIKWTVEKLSLRKKINNILLLIVISLPNFCIWTSMWSKEVFGLVFSAFISVLFIRFINGNFKINIIDIFGFYICILFKPQYMPFILQGLIFIYISQKILKHKPFSQLLLAIVFLCINILFLYLIRDVVNRYAGMMYQYFVDDEARSTRENIFLNDNDFFRYIPWGMFIAFFGPTLSEMLVKPFQAIAGIESIFIILLFFYLSKNIFIKFFLKFRFYPIIIISYFIIFFGICFIHYPFGVFNPGSAIRYRNNFIFIFIILLLYLYSKKDNLSRKYK